MYNHRSPESVASGKKLDLSNNYNLDLLMTKAVMAKGPRNCKYQPPAAPRCLCSFVCVPLHPFHTVIPGDALPRTLLRVRGENS